jgi:predicted P-loop ATPase
LSSDIERLRRDVSLPDTAAGFGVVLEEDGDEWIACCPFHAEDTPSFTIFTGQNHTQRFHCFGCGERGDVVDFVQKIKGVGTREAINILSGDKARPNLPPKAVDAVSIYAKILPLDPVEEIEVGRKIKLYNPKRAGHEWEWGQFKPSMVFPYRRIDGSILGYVLRRELPSGRKETPMVMWARLPDGRETWCRFPFSKPRPLYGLTDLRAGQVIIVEGEKCRDRLAPASGRNVVTWPGGTYGVHHTDWSPLAKRSVVIWPDADAPGVKTAENIAAILGKLGCTIKIMDVSGASKEGWDCADAIDGGWSKDDLDAFMRAKVKPWSPPTPPEPPASAAEPRPVDPAVSMPAGPSTPVTQARTVSQEQPEQATVTHIHTRQTVAADDGWQLQLVFNDEGKVKPGIAKNWALFLENHPDTRGVFAFDAFKHRVMLMRRPPWEREGASWEPRSLRDSDYAEAVMWLEAKYMTPKVSTIAPIVQTVAERSSFDRLREYLEGLEWDGRERIGKFANEYLGCAGDNYAPVVSERWLISSAARGLKPGCKVDTMPILEGPQGALKSTALRVLYGSEFFTDELSDIGSKDAMMELQGVWGLEVAEMHRFSAAETNTVKKFLSRQTDRFRPPYGRSVIEAPRRVILCGTINPEGNAYLRDPTGARRFWPLEVGRIDIDRIAKDRDQLWAEAVAHFREGTPWWVQQEEAASVEVEQERRTDVDIWTAVIAPLLQARTSITELEVFEAIGIPKKDADIRHAARVGRVMKKLGWTRRRDRTNGNDRTVFENPKAMFADGEQETIW